MQVVPRHMTLIAACNPLRSHADALAYSLTEAEVNGGSRLNHTTKTLDHCSPSSFGAQCAYIAASTPPWAPKHVPPPCLQAIIPLPGLPIAESTVLTNEQGHNISEAATIDFGSVWPVVTVGSGATLVLQDVVLAGLQNPLSSEVAAQPPSTLRPRGFELWPSIDVRNGSTVRRQLKPMCVVPLVLWPADKS